MVSFSLSILLRLLLSLWTTRTTSTQELLDCESDMTGLADERIPLVVSRGATTTRRSNNNSSMLCSGEVCNKTAMVVMGVLLVIAAFEFYFVVPPGNVGIVVTLGHVKAYDPGLHFRAPYVSTLELLTTKTQLLEQENVIPTVEGLTVKLDTAV